MLRPPSPCYTAAGLPRQPGPQEEPERNQQRIPVGHVNILRGRLVGCSILLGWGCQQVSLPATGRASRNCNWTWRKCRNIEGSSCDEK